MSTMPIVKEDGTYDLGAATLHMNLLFDNGKLAAESDGPSDLGNDRILYFIKILQEEVLEMAEALALATNDIERLVIITDCLTDIMVYARSEGHRWGLPLEESQALVMLSQESKLGPDGKPIWNKEGTKFEKGPNYKPPEEAIRQLLLSRLKGANVDRYAPVLPPGNYLLDTISEKTLAYVISDNSRTQFQCVKCRGWLARTMIRRVLKQLETEEVRNYRCPECTEIIRKDLVLLILNPAERVPS